MIAFAEIELYDPDMVILADTAALAKGSNWDILTRGVEVITILSAVVTGVFALIQWKKDLRWKQAELARTMLDEIFDYDPSNDAWRMVDGETSFKDSDGVPCHITMTDVRAALPRPISGVWDDSPSPQVYIRWCFDALFYFLERLESSLEIKIIVFRDIKAPVLYYVRLMAKTDRELYLSYATTIGFDGAITFLNRFDEWRDKSETTP